MRHAAELIAAEAGNLLFVYAILLALSCAAILCGIAKEETPL